MADVSVDHRPAELRKARCAIVFADLVESVRHYGDNEALAIERWRCFAEQAREGGMALWGGRLVRTDGDGLLVEFPDAARAVGGAFALHAAMQAVNAAYPSAEPMMLRVGAHVADVVFDAHEAYGAGVNLAQRVTGLAQPGQTLVSAQARDGLVDGLHAQVQDMGLRFVKHIDTPVRTFRVSPAGQDLVLRPPAAETSAHLSPTLAVVPFSPMDGDPAHSALGHAIADDVIAALSRHPGLRVVSRLSTAAFRDISLDWTQLQQLLGATFVLSGRTYVSGDRVRLSLELAETTRGQVLWADTLRTQVQAVFDGQDEMVPMVVHQVAQQVAAHELARVRSLPMDTLQSYTLYLGAEGLMGSLVRQDFHRSREVLEHLAERHPRQAAPHAMLSRWHVNHIVQQWSEDEKIDQARGFEHALRALDIAGDNPAALASAGLAQLNLKGDAGGAQNYFEQALRGDPQNPATWAWLSATHCYQGDLGAAQDASERALVLSPLDPSRYLYEAYAAMVGIAGGRFTAAVAHARQSLRLHALHAPSHTLLVASLWLAGEKPQARMAAHRLMANFPKAHSGSRTARGLGSQAGWREHFSDALREAGVPALASNAG